MQSKVAQRRQQTQKNIEAIAARHFAACGVSSVSVEEILHEAEISRRTFYTFFANKHELIAGIVLPVFEDGISKLETIPSGGNTLNAIIEVYLELWQQHQDAFFLSSQLEGKAFELVEKQHNDFVFSLLALLQKAEASGQLKNNSADYSLKLIARAAVPILKIYAEDEMFPELFRSSMQGLLG